MRTALRSIRTFGPEGRSPAERTESLVSPQVRTGVFTALAAVVAYLMASRSAGGGLVVVGVAGLVFVLGVFAFPRAAFILALVSTATVLIPRDVQIAAAGIRTDPAELIALFLIALWAMSWFRDKRPLPAVPRGTWPIGAAALVGITVGYLRGADQQLLLGQSKVYLFYLLLLPLSMLFATSEQKAMLERWVVRLATLGSLYVLSLVARGIPVPTSDLTNAFNTLGVEADAQRVRPPLLELLVIATLLLIARILAEEVTLWRITQLGLFSTVWAFSFFRSAWFGLVVATVVLALLRLGPARPLRAVRFAVALGVMLPLLWFGASSGLLGPSSQEVVRRVASTLSPDLSKESSYTDRALENEEALAAIRANPVLGVGVARPYGARRAVYDHVRQRTIYVDRPYAHNSYIHAYLQLGLVGLAALAVLALGVVRSVASALRSGAFDDRVRAAGAGAGLLAMAIKAAFLPMLVYRPAILALVVGIVLALPPERESAVSPDLA